MRNGLLALLLGLVSIGCCLPGWHREEDGAGAARDPAAPLALGAPPAPAPAAPARLGHLAEGTFDALANGNQPQPREVTALWESARDARHGSIERGMLICQARVHGAGFDDSFFAGGADVALAARFADGPLRSTAQSGHRIYTFPIARLDPGDALWIRVLDVDVFFNDTIAEGSARFERAPFTLTMGQADVECRAVDPELVSRRTDTAVARLGLAIDALDDAEPDVSAYDVGYPTDEAARVTAAASDVLAWTDASSPRYRAAIDRAVAFDAEWQRRAGAAVLAAESALPPPGAPVALGTGRELTVREVVCGAGASTLVSSMGATALDIGLGGCLAVVELSSPRATSLPPLSPVSQPWEAWSLDARGDMSAAPVVARRQGDRWIAPDETVAIAPGESVEVVLALPAHSSARLLRVGDGGRPAVLRVR
jgi:hypothetical protein